jgi:Ala-tRNA(Pro) deacylase
MAIAQTLQRYLDQTTTYEVVPHEPTLSSMRTAEACHISGERLAKGVVLRRGSDYLLAVLPASHHIEMESLRAQLGEDIALASEDEIVPLFRDCVRGAVPPVGECYALDVIIDDSIEALPDVYIEGGDHATLIHMSRDEFVRLAPDARHGRFSRHN